jgi:hypothetical protein
MPLSDIARFERTRRFQITLEYPDNGQHDLVPDFPQEICPGLLWAHERYLPYRLSGIALELLQICDEKERDGVVGIMMTLRELRGQRPLLAATMLLRVADHYDE